MRFRHAPVTCSKVARFSRFKFTARGSIKTLLKELGINVKCGAFWYQDRQELGLLYDDARKLYKRLAIQVHPRKVGDSEEAAKTLHALWGVIERRFEQHLHPQLTPTTKHQTPQTPGLGPVCPWCEHVYKKTRSWQTHCSRRCTANHSKARQRAKVLAARLLVKCAYSRCNVRFQSTRGRKYHSLRCQERAAGHRHYDQHRAEINRQQRAAYWSNPEASRARLRSRAGWKGWFDKLSDNRKEEMRRRDARRHREARKVKRNAQPELVAA